MAGYIFLIFAVALLLNLPIAISLGIAAVVFTLFLSSLPVDLIVQAYISGVDSFPLLAVPFFILAGDIMVEGGISARLVRFSMSLLKNTSGALGLVSVLTAAIFASISGSGPATVACVGGIMIPAMIRNGYDRPFSCALVASAGTLGPVIPPSICFIIYGIVAQQSITDLFIAGIIPGLLMAGALMLVVRFVAKRMKYGVSSENISVRAAFKEARWSLLVPGIILGGIYGGIFTPTEAAIIACMYAIFIGIFVYKEITFKDLYPIFARTALVNGTVLILVSTATAFGRILAMEQLPAFLTAQLMALSNDKYVILLVINVFLFFVGMVMETLAAVIILAPLCLSIVLPLGVDPIHFGVIMTVNLVIGMCTPPVGVNLFVASRIGGLPIEAMFKWLVLMLGSLLVVLMLVTYIPQVSLLLPNLMHMLR
jgi:C4-dicarboxylate transporter DctM subunit